MKESTPVLPWHRPSRNASIQRPTSEWRCATVVVQRWSRTFGFCERYARSWKDPGERVYLLRGEGCPGQRAGHNGRGNTFLHIQPARSLPQGRCVFQGSESPQSLPHIQPGFIQNSSPSRNVARPRNGPLMTMTSTLDADGLAFRTTKGGTAELWRARRGSMHGT